MSDLLATQLAHQTLNFIAALSMRFTPVKGKTSSSAASPPTLTQPFSKTGTSAEEKATSIISLLEFVFLTGTSVVPSQATYTLPIIRDENYQVSLRYKSGTDRASNIPVTIDHADGIAEVAWNMKKGSRFEFAVPVGTCRFVASKTNTFTFSTAGTDGKVIADSIALVKAPGQTTGDKEERK